ncbi:MAG: N-acetylmuramoyl-L-alanine amidase [Actinobacteria bacterium]|nr:N-acetylmuramoyl-L-alanine amidase [Actinomycetota bacterium]
MDEETFDAENSNISEEQTFDLQCNERMRRRRIIRDVLFSVAALLIAGLLITGLIVLLATGGRGPKVPDLVGKSYKEARSEASAAKFGIEIDSMQDSSIECDDLEVIEQYPKAGSEVEQGDIIIVRLKGLYESERALGTDGGDGSLTPGSPGAEADGQAADQADSGNPGTEPGSVYTVCLDPGHSTGCPSSEIDSMTGLNVADNGGAAGELATNWEVAVKTKEQLEQAGYTVKMTKNRPDTYASLRTRSDIGNSCSIMVRIHFDPSLHALLYPAEGQYKQNGTSIKYVDPNVAAGSARLANAMYPYLQNVGVTSLQNDCGGTSANTGSAFVGSVLSTVPVVVIENDPAMVRNNPVGQDRVAGAILQGVHAYFAGI